MTAGNHNEVMRVAPPDLETMASRVRRLREPYTDNPDAITTALLQDLEIAYPASAVLWPWLKERVQHELRSAERRDTARRTREERAEAGRLRAVQSGTEVTTHLQRRDARRTGPLAFLDAKVWRSYLGNRGWKFYRELTAEECARIGVELLRSASPVMASARGYQWSARILQEHGAETLTDVSDEVLLAALPEEGIRP